MPGPTLSWEQLTAILRSSTSKAAIAELPPEQAAQINDWITFLISQDAVKDLYEILSTTKVVTTKLSVMCSLD